MLGPIEEERTEDVGTVVRTETRIGETERSTKGLRERERWW